MSQFPTSWLRPGYVAVPRRLLVAVVGAALLWGTFRMMTPSSSLLQQLDSPDGRRSARLFRTRDVRVYLTVRVRNGGLWQTAYMTPPLTNDLRMDLGERLFWSEDSARVSLRMNGAPVWHYDFEPGRESAAPP
jgi:hypothetical protein